MELKATRLGFTKSFKADWLHLTGRNGSRFSAEGAKGVWKGPQKQTIPFRTTVQVQTRPLIKALDLGASEVSPSYPGSLGSDKVISKQSFIKRVSCQRTRDREGRVWGFQSTLPHPAG